MHTHDLLDINGFAQVLPDVNPFDLGSASSGWNVNTVVLQVKRTTNMKRGGRQHMMSVLYVATVLEILPEGLVCYKLQPRVYCYSSLPRACFLFHNFAMLYFFSWKIIFRASNYSDFTQHQTVVMVHQWIRYHRNSPLVCISATCMHAFCPIHFALFFTITDATVRFTFPPRVLVRWLGTETEPLAMPWARLLNFLTPCASRRSALPATSWPLIVATGTRSTMMSTPSLAARGCICSTLHKVRRNHRFCLVSTLTRTVCDDLSSGVWLWH